MIWKCREKKIEYGEKTLIMGILNVTPDSFSDGGRFQNTEKAVKHALEMINDGADIIDIGAQSTRPEYEEIPPEEEWARLEPVLSGFGGGARVSVDTYHPETARRAIGMGATLVNCVYAAPVPEMVALMLLMVASSTIH